MLPPPPPTLSSPRSPLPSLFLSKNFSHPHYFSENRTSYQYRQNSPHNLILSFNLANMMANMVQTAYQDMMLHSPLPIIKEEPPMTPDTPDFPDMIAAGADYVGFDDLPTVTPAGQFFSHQLAYENDSVNGDLADEPMSGVLPNSPYPAALDQPANGIPTHLIPGLNLTHDDGKNNNTNANCHDVKRSSKNKKHSKRSGARPNKQAKKEMEKTKRGNNNANRNEKSDVILEHSAESRRLTKALQRRKHQKCMLAPGNEIFIDVNKANENIPKSIVGAIAFHPKKAPQADKPQVNDLQTKAIDRIMADGNHVDPIELYNNERLGKHNIIPSNGTHRRPSRAAKSRVEDQRRATHAQEIRQDNQRRNMIKYSLRGVSKKKNSDEFERRKVLEKARRDMGDIVLPQELIAGVEPPSPLHNRKVPRSLMRSFSKLDI